MVALLALVLTGCAPTPASIKFEGDATVTVHSLDAVAVKKATVLDAEGKAIEPQPTDLSWSVNPATVATLDKTMVKPVGAGEATVEAKLGDVKASYKFIVALADKVEIAGYTAGTPGPATTTVALTANVMAGADKVEGMTATWESANTAVATVDAAGLVTAVADGVATITVKAGELTSTVDVTVGPAAAVAADAAAAPAAK